MFVDEIGDVARSKTISVDGKGREFDSALNQLRSPERGGHIRHRVTRELLKKGSKVIRAQGGTIVFEGLVIEGSRPGMPVNCGDLLSIVGALPPRQVLDALHAPSRFGHRADPGEIPLSGIWTESTIKPDQDGRNINESGLSTTEDFNVAAMWILSGVVDDAGRNRIEVDIRNDLPKVVLRVDHPGPITALP